MALFVNQPQSATLVLATSLSCNYHLSTDTGITRRATSSPSYSHLLGAAFPAP